MSRLVLWLIVLLAACAPARRTEPFRLELANQSAVYVQADVYVAGRQESLRLSPGSDVELPFAVAPSQIVVFVSYGSALTQYTLMQGRDYTKGMRLVL